MGIRAIIEQRKECTETGHHIEGVIKNLRNLVTEVEDEMAKGSIFLGADGPETEENRFTTKDVLKYMYIEPQSDIKVNALLHNHIIDNPSKKILVQADGGVGKSTLLAKIYKELAKKFLTEELVCPIYYSLRRQKLQPTSLEAIISLRKGSSIVLPKTDSCEFVILIDGLDEINNRRAELCGIEDLSLKDLRLRGNKSPAPPVEPPQRGAVLTAQGLRP